MKRILSFSIAGMLFAGMVIGASAQSSSDSSPSLGDVARATRAEKKPDTSKYFDNDTMPKNDKLSVVGNAAPESTDANNNVPMGETQAAPSTPATQTADDKNTANDDLKNQIADAQSKVDLLTRELDVAQKEYQLRAAAFYGDAGERLRNAGTWDKQDSSSKDDIAQKQKDLDEAKQELSDLQEQAHKSGVDLTK